jgi:hypothetical protein
MKTHFTQRTRANFRLPRAEISRTIRCSALLRRLV